ncbi:MAG: hypothetical protein ABF719_02990 [Acetobacter sp.]|uniref:hypothetical protein n=1 Tax=Acetobacter sp. TaxID=440 RepID=UPI0039E7E7D8
MSASSFQVAARTIIAIGGGYLASSSAMAIFCLLLVSAGLARADAVTLGILLVFVLYLCLLIWSFAVSALWRPITVFSLLIVSDYGLAFFIGHGR